MGESIGRILTKSNKKIICLNDSKNSAETYQRYKVCET